MHHAGMPFGLARRHWFLCLQEVTRLLNIFRILPNVLDERIGRRGVVLETGEGSTKNGCVHTCARTSGARLCLLGSFICFKGLFVGKLHMP
eukprot:jgi/Botrbrau1/8412/Bobra.0237s0032.1